MADGVIRAAGGAVWRRAADGTLEVLVVHRPKYDDWTLPKGKAEPGEDDPDTARREVKEETGLACTLGPELARVRYTDRHGRPKVARYWAMTADHAEPFVANDEVDECPWVAVDRAAALLTYPRDATVLDALRRAADSGQI